MANYHEMDHDALTAEKAALEEEYKQFQAKGLKLNMARGKPGPHQMDLAMDLLKMTDYTTVLAPLIVDLMTGSLVVEKIFAIPGVGSLLVTAIQSNDYNVVIGLSFIYSAMYIGIMLVVDLLYGIIDPRIRLAKGDD